MDTKTTPYNRNISCPFKQLFKIKHVNNAPYILGKGKNGYIYLYQIDKSKHHSLNKKDNTMYTNPNDNNNAWIHISTIRNKQIKWRSIEVILYSQHEHLLWFIFDHSDQYRFEIMGYSIQQKQSLLFLF